MLFHGCAVIRALNCKFVMVMETMDGGAFGSLVAVVNVANIAIRSVGHKIVPASRIRLFQDPSGSIHQSTQVPENTTIQVWYCELYNII
jgi:hypothetical protein